ncbi:hypothetical protein ACIOWI_36005 [Streptomyces sp. NPDC087659]|uniref:hypothetical protein n=1 Tax=Streptomyces sp. NPDC087659 TaxID=3365801 RepID=UPI0037FD958E
MRANVPERDEQGLRELLERVTPHLMAPPERMAQVHRRAVRRRRQRAVGILGGVVATASVMVATMVTTLPSDHDVKRKQEHAEVAAPRSPQPEQDIVIPFDTTADTEEFGPGPDYGLALTTPTGWQIRTGRIGSSIAHAANHAMDGSFKDCNGRRPATLSCAPLYQMPLGGSLVEFEVLASTDKQQYSGRLELTGRPVTASQACKARNGVREYRSTLLLMAGGTALRATLCMAPGERGEVMEPGSDVEQLLELARVVRMKDRTP